MMRERTVVKASILGTFLTFALSLVCASGAVAASGVQKVELDAPEGRVTVFLPDDMAAGDTVSASIKIYPDGPTEALKGANASALGGYLVETSYFSVPAKQGSVRFQVPRNSAGSSILFTLKDRSGKKYGNARVPVGMYVERGISDDAPTPFDYQCPLVGQAGRLIEIKGPFDGDFTTTDFRVGGKNPVLLSESPRKLVFESPDGVAGTVELVLTEREVVVTRPFTCLQVVKIDESGAVPVSSSAVESPDTIAEAPVRTEPLARVKQSLEFGDIKAEETLSGPAPGDEPLFREPSPDPSGHISDSPSASADAGPGGTKEIILARQMEAPIHSRTQAPEPAAQAVPVPDKAVTELPADSSDDLIEKPLEQAAPAESETGPVTGADTLPAVASDADLPPLPLEAARKAEILDSQMLAAYAGPAGGVNSVRTPSGVTRTTTKKGFSVQVASTRTAKDAETVASQLRKKGYDAYVVSADVPGKGKWYRVRVGSFTKRQEARSFAEKLKRKEPLAKAAYVAEND